MQTAFLLVSVVRSRIIQSPAELEGLRSLWDELAQSGSIFQSFRWNRLAAECFAMREHPYVICCETDAGAAILPAVIRADGVVSLLGETLFDYRDVLQAGEPDATANAFQQLCRLDRPFALTALRGEEARARWRQANPKPFTYAPGVSRAEASSAEFLKQHPKLGRFSRRIARSGVSLRRHSGGESELVRFIYECKGKQAELGGDENLFQDRLRREFMVRIAAEEGARCELFTYETASELVASLVTFRDDAVRYFYTTYYDPRWAEFSPGQVLLYEVAALALADGLDCDYMTGEGLHKNRLATSRAPLFTVELSANGLRAMAQAHRPAEKIA